MLNCIIIDDETHVISLLKTYINQTSFLNLAYSTNDSIDGLKYLYANPVSIIFLDSDMPKLSGNDIANIISDKNKIIFTTDDSDYSKDNYGVDIGECLTKPISYERFQNSLSRFANTIKKNEVEVVDYLFVRLENKAKKSKINFEDIAYIESFKNYVVFHLKNDEPIKTLSTLIELLNILPSSFIRIHKSYILSVSMIKGLDKNKVLLKLLGNEIHIPIGPNYKKGFLRKIEENTIHC